MDFSEALKFLKSGFKVKRPEWVGCLQLQRPDENSKMNQPYIYATCKGGQIVPAALNMLDVMAEDWELVKS